MDDKTTKADNHREANATLATKVRTYQNVATWAGLMGPSILGFVGGWLGAPRIVCRGCQKPPRPNADGWTIDYVAGPAEVLRGSEDRTEENLTTVAPASLYFCRECRRAQGIDLDPMAQLVTWGFEVTFGPSHLHEGLVAVTAERVLPERERLTVIAGNVRSGCAELAARLLPATCVAMTVEDYMPPRTGC